MKVVLVRDTLPLIKFWINKSQTIAHYFVGLGSVFLKQFGVIVLAGMASLFQVFQQQPFNLRIGLLGKTGPENDGSGGPRHPNTETEKVFGDTPKIYASRTTPQEVLDV